MLPSKRSSFSSSKSSKYNGKLKEVLPSSTRPKPSEPKVPDIKDFSNVPLVKQADNLRLVPKYTSILSKNSDEGVCMDDLDQLQQDLETLLCTNALRTRFFLGEYSQADQKDGHEKKTHDKVSLKRKKPDEKPKYKDMKNGLRGVKRDPFKTYNENSFKEIPKITLPRNDNSDKFWASIEPYCAPVTKDDVAFLDTLIQEFSKDIDIKIPDIGEHYANTWSEELINDEQNLGKSPAKKSSDFKKNGLHTMVDTFGSPYTQRLLSALIEERAIKASGIKNDENGPKPKKLKTSEFSKVKQNISQKVGTCLEKRLLKELIEQGILTNDNLDDMNKSGQESGYNSEEMRDPVIISNNDINKKVADDEILAEIKKCQQELITVNKYNLEELNKLRSTVINDIHCTQLKNDLDKIDKEVLDLYNNIIAARVQDEGKDYDKIFSEKMINVFECKANALLRQQHVLNREINSMTDMSMLY